MMQLSKGAGLVELIGFNEYEQKENYKIYKPLLNITKDELENYLKTNHHKYFIDESNFDEKYKRNYFRHNFSNKFLEEFIIKSQEHLYIDGIVSCPYTEKNVIKDILILVPKNELINTI